jgi:acid stress chaperone HdeB
MNTEKLGSGFHHMQHKTLMVVWHLIVIGAIIPSVAQAQVMIDMSKVTCADYLAMPPQQARTFSAWMSGYFNQKSGYAWVDLGAYARNIANIKQWCASYPTETVMTGLKWATTKQNQ